MRHPSRSLLRSLLLLSALSLGCGGGEEPRRTHRSAPILLSWAVQHPRWGREAIFLEDLSGAEPSSGARVRYMLDPPERGGARVRAALDLSEEEVGQLRERLRALEACSLRSHREALDANESRPRLRLRFGDLRCERELYYGEWREGEAARVYALIDGLKARVRAQGRRQPADENSDNEREDE